MSFWQRAYSEKSPYAKGWFWAGTLVQIGLLALGLSSFGHNDIEGSTWANPDVAVAASLLLLLAAAGLMHAFDKKKDGYGVRHVYREAKSAHRIDDNVISGVLARESIQGAITLGILGALIANVQLPASAGELFKNSQLVFRSVISITLGISVVTTLVGILCYDYASRFRWAAGIRNLFISKGHNLGQWGFYSLMWSLAAIPALKSYYLCMFAVLIVFWVTWYYYFFPVEKVKTFLPGYKKPNMGDVDLNGKVLDGIHLESVNLARAKLEGASLQRARLTNTSLEGAHLKGAKLQDALLADATLTGAELHGADLTGSDVTQKQIDSAKGDQETMLPNGLRAPATWNPTGT
jgi:hypothetical protein